MSDQDGEILFEYLRSILFDSKSVKPDLKQLSPNVQDLEEGMEYLDACVRKMNSYAASLSRGNLSENFPGDCNELCMNLKNLHANLNHLTWQAQRVAEGDYSQKVSYLGEFSAAFNTMTEQLKEREALLKKQAEEEQKRAEIFKSYNELLVKLTQHRNEWIFVVEKGEKKILYCNKNLVNKDEVEIPNCQNCSNKLPVFDEILSYEGSEQDKEWELEDENAKTCYQIQSHQIFWEGLRAYAHIVSDVTKERMEERFLSNLAYKDAGTGLHNRRYLEDTIIYRMHVKEPFSLVFIDLDGLKYVNDNYGHAEGNMYIQLVTSHVLAKIRPEDILARVGGDEFVVIFDKCPKRIAVHKMAELMKEMHMLSHREKPYYIGFSYGVVYVDEEEQRTVNELLEEADQLMYQCKKRHKLEYDSGRRNE